MCPSKRKVAVTVLLFFYEGCLFTLALGLFERKPTWKENRSKDLLSVRTNSPLILSRNGFFPLDEEKRIGLEEGRDHERRLPHGQKRLDEEVLEMLFRLSLFLYEGAFFRTKGPAQ